MAMGSGIRLPLSQWLQAAAFTLMASYKSFWLKPSVSLAAFRRAPIWTISSLFRVLVISEYNLPEVLFSVDHLGRYRKIALPNCWQHSHNGINLDLNSGDNKGLNGGLLQKYELIS
jgi:hypothetical protein